jgi:Bax protein
MRFFTALLLFGALLFADTTKAFPASYYDIKDPQARKEAFVKILYPLVIREEKKIQAQRAFVQSVFGKIEAGDIVTPAELAQLKKLAKTYRIASLYDKSAYLKRIDTIPVSLVLAQAAIESNWGRSRFARVANNLFGEWTWGKRGIIPRNRPEGKRYKIRIFDSLEASIASYMRNLNRHWAYQEFREARAEARVKGLPFSGFVAAAYLTHYSQRGEEYTKMVKTKIAKNGWDLYDLPTAPAVEEGSGEMVMLSREIFRR